MAKVKVKPIHIYLDGQRGRLGKGKGRKYTDELYVPRNTKYEFNWKINKFRRWIVFWVFFSFLNDLLPLAALCSCSDMFSKHLAVWTTTSEIIFCNLRCWTELEDGLNVFIVIWGFYNDIDNTRSALSSLIIGIIIVVGVSTADVKCVLCLKAYKISTCNHACLKCCHCHYCR